MYTLIFWKHVETMKWVVSNQIQEGGREEGREGGREAGREGGREGGMERGREGGR